MWLALNRPIPVLSYTVLCLGGGVYFKYKNRERSSRIAARLVVLVGSPLRGAELAHAPRSTPFIPHCKIKKEREKKEKKKSPLRGVVVTFIIAVCSLKISERLDHQQRVSQSFIHL